MGAKEQEDQQEGLYLTFYPSSSPFIRVAGPSVP